jgi:hypothetical protein
VHREDAKGRVFSAPHGERLVDGAGIDGYWLLAFHQIHRHVERVRARRHHRGQVLALIGLADRGDRHHAVHECASDHRGNLADFAAGELALDRLEAPPEAVGVAHHGVDPRFLDRLEYPRRVPGRPRLFDEQVEPALARGQQRADMGVLVGRNDRRRDFRALQQLVVVGGEEIGPCVFGEFLADLRIGPRQPMPG